MPRNTTHSPPSRARRLSAVVATTALVGGTLMLAPAATAAVAPGEAPNDLGLTGADVLTHLTQVSEICEPFSGQRPVWTTHGPRSRRR